MFTFDPNMEVLFSRCVPFDEGKIAQSESYQEIHDELRSVRKFLERRAPEIMSCIDSYMDTYLELVDLECRHYFAEGYRLGFEKIVQLNNISTSSNDKSG